MAIARRVGLCLAVSLFTVGSSGTDVVAQVPSVATTSPQAVAPGATTDVKLRGGSLVGAANVWTSFPAKTVLTPEVKDNGKNAAEVTWRFEVPADAPVGVHGIRVATAGGTSGLKLILVDDLPSVAQAAGNTTPDKAQELTLPVAVDGAVAALTRNYYKFKATKGQKLSIEAVARRLGSALDPMIRLLDVNGRELAWSDDEAGLRGDARLQHTFDADGDYSIEVRDIRYQGGGGHFYRLRVGDFPIISVPYPMGGKRGSQSVLTFVGPDVDGVAPASLQIPEGSVAEVVNVGAKRIDGRSSGLAMLRVSDAPAKSEAEPNNTIEAASKVTLGDTLVGRIDSPGDVDHFRITAKKGQKYTFRAITRRVGSPTSVYLRLLNATGGQVAAKEDFGVGDATFDYTFPADGDYLVAVEELHRRGGSEFAYLIEVGVAENGFVLTAATNTVNIGAGSTTAITVNSVRKGYNGPIQIAAVDLPAGVTSNPTVIGPGMNTVVLTLTSTADAPLNLAAAIKVTGSAQIGDKSLVVLADTEAAMKGGFNALPWAPQSLSKHVALGVGPKPQIRLRVETPNVVFGKQLSGTVKVIVERAEGFNEAITLAVTPDPKKSGLPGNITAALKPIPKDQNEAVITFTATDKAALGEFTAVLTGTIKQGKTTVTQTVPGVTLKLQVPLKVSLVPSAEKLTSGGELKVRVAVERNPALKGEVVLTFQNLPKGVTVAEAKIAADKNEGEFVLKAAADAAKGAIANLNVKGEVTVGKVKLGAASANVKLIVE